MDKKMLVQSIIEEMEISENELIFNVKGLETQIEEYKEINSSIGIMASMIARDIVCLINGGDFVPSHEKFNSEAGNGILTEGFSEVVDKTMSYMISILRQLKVKLGSMKNLPADDKVNLICNISAYLIVNNIGNGNDNDTMRKYTLFLLAVFMRILKKSAVSIGGGLGAATYNNMSEIFTEIAAVRDITIDAIREACAQEFFPWSSYEPENVLEATSTEHLYGTDVELEGQAFGLVAMYKLFLNTCAAFPHMHSNYMDRIEKFAPNLHQLVGTPMLFGGDEYPDIDSLDIVDKEE